MNFVTRRDFLKIGLASIATAAVVASGLGGSAASVTSDGLLVTEKGQALLEEQALIDEQALAAHRMSGFALIDIYQKRAKDSLAGMKDNEVFAGIATASSQLSLPNLEINGA